MKVTPSRKIKITLPNLATARDGRVCFYGYDVSMEWLVTYGTAHWCWGPLGPEFDDLSKASGAMQLLRLNSGIKGLKFETAIKDPNIDAVTIPGHRELGEIRVPLISIFSDEGPSFKKRPTEEQVHRLSEIIGKQPRWWADYENPETYGE